MVRTTTSRASLRAACLHTMPRDMCEHDTGDIYLGSAVHCLIGRSDRKTVFASVGSLPIDRMTRKLFLRVSRKQIGRCKNPLIMQCALIR